MQRLAENTQKSSEPNICKWELDYFKRVLIFEKLPVSGCTEKFCGGFPIEILTKYPYVSYMNEEYNANNNVLLFRISFDTKIFLLLTLVDGVGVNSARQTPEESAL